MLSGVYRKFVWAGVILLAIVLIGTVGYWFIGGRQYSFVDTLYMTVITITTIGFEEVIDLSGNVGGRIFTTFIAISGIGVMAYILTSITALVVEGELTESFRRRRMERIAGKYKDHYIVCGCGSVGSYIADEGGRSGQREIMAYAILPLDSKGKPKVGRGPDGSTSFYLKRSIKHYGPSELAQAMKGSTGFLLVDVRTKAERQESHIPGSIHLPLQRSI